MAFGSATGRGRMSRLTTNSSVFRFVSVSRPTGSAWRPVIFSYRSISCRATERSVASSRDWCEVGFARPHRQRIFDRDASSSSEPESRVASSRRSPNWRRFGPPSADVSASARPSGVSYRQLKTEVVTERVKDLLVDERLAVAEVAKSTGFASAGALCRAFKRTTGMTPLSYRRARRMA